MCKYNLNFVLVLFVGFLITVVPMAHAQNRLDYLNVIQKTLEDVQQSERDTNSGNGMLLQMPADKVRLSSFSRFRRKR